MPRDAVYENKNDIVLVSRNNGREVKCLGYVPSVRYEHPLIKIKRISGRILSPRGNRTTHTHLNNVEIFVAGRVKQPGR